MKNLFFLVTALLISLTSCVENIDPLDNTPPTKCQRLDNGVYEVHSINTLINHGDIIMVGKDEESHKVRVIREEQHTKIAGISKYTAEYFMTVTKESGCDLPEEIDEVCKGDIMLVDEQCNITFYKPGNPIQGNVRIYIIE